MFAMKARVVLVLAFLSFDASAYSCDNLSSSVDEAQRQLKRAAGETELDSAQTYMRRAQSALEETSYSARDCGCDYASSEFDDAATKAQRAKNASDGDDFSYQYGRAVRAFNSAIDSFNSCQPERD